MYLIIFLIFIGILIFFWVKGKGKDKDDDKGKRKNLDRSKGEQFNPEYSSKPDAEKKKSSYDKEGN